MTKKSAKELWTNHKRWCLLIIIGIISAVVYLTTGQEIPVEETTDKACTTLGGC